MRTSPRLADHLKLFEIWLTTDPVRKLTYFEVYWPGTDWNVAGEWQDVPFATQEAAIVGARRWIDQRYFKGTNQRYNPGRRNSPRQVACPACNATIGEPCISLRDLNVGLTSVPMVTYHSDRRSAAKAALSMEQSLSELKAKEPVNHEAALISVCDELYGGSWDALEADLRNRLARTPITSRLVALIERDLAAIAKLRHSGRYLHNPEEIDPRIDLYRQMADITRERCGSCYYPRSCCDPMYCQVAMEHARKYWDVELTPTEHSVLPLMGSEGCIAPPHLRPICTVHICEKHLMRDPEFAEEYFELRDALSDLEFREYGRRHHP